MIVVFEECIIVVVDQSSFTNIDSFTIRSSIHVFINIEINHFRDHHVERVQTASQHDTSQVAPVNDHRDKVNFQTYQTLRVSVQQKKMEFVEKKSGQIQVISFVKLTKLKKYVSIKMDVNS